MTFFEAIVRHALNGVGAPLQSAAINARTWCAEALGVGVEDVDVDPGLALITASAHLNEPVRIGPLVFCPTESGDLGVWVGEPGDKPSHPNYNCWGKGDTATKALEMMAKRAVLQSSTPVLDEGSVVEYWIGDGHAHLMRPVADHSPPTRAGHLACPISADFWPH